MTRLLLLIFGVLTLAMIASTQDRGVVEEANISEELASSPQLRSPEAGAKRKKRRQEKKKKRKRNEGKK